MARVVWSCRGRRGGLGEAGGWGARSVHPPSSSSVGSARSQVPQILLLVWEPPALQRRRKGAAFRGFWGWGRRMAISPRRTPKTGLALALGPRLGAAALPRGGIVRAQPRSGGLPAVSVPTSQARRAPAAGVAEGGGAGARPGGLGPGTSCPWVGGGHPGELLPTAARLLGARAARLLPRSSSARAKGE